MKGIVNASPNNIRSTRYCSERGGSTEAHKHAYIMNTP